MKDFSGNKNEQLVYALSNHDLLGYVIEAYAVILDSGSQFSLTYKKLYQKTLIDHNFVLSDFDTQLLKVIEECSEDSICDRFCNTNATTKEFLAQLKIDYIERHIRPYIDRRIVKCLSILQKGKIKLFFKGKKNASINDIPIHIVETPAEAVFNFIREQLETRYFLTLNAGGVDLTLNRKDAVIITHQPCWLLLNNHLYSLNDSVDGKKLIPFFSKDYISVPKRSEKEYFQKFVLPAIAHFTVRNKGFEIIEKESLPLAFLKLEETLEGIPHLVLFFKYEDKSFFYHDTIKQSVVLDYQNNHFTFFKILRNFKEEKRYASLLLDLGLINQQGSGFSLLYNKSSIKVFSKTQMLVILINWINEHSSFLKDHEFEIVQDYFHDKYLTDEINLSLQIEQRIDWFDLNGYAFFGTFRVPFISLKKNILNHITEYQLPNGEIAIIPESWFARFKDIFSLANREKDKLSLHKHHFGMLEDIISDDERSKFAQYQRLRQPASLNSAEVPSSLKAKLRPYQLEGFAWLIYLNQLQLGGCLADDMGLGKTLQTLALLLSIQEKTVQVNQPSPSYQPDLFNTEPLEKKMPVCTSLIVMPLSLIHNWFNEIMRFAPSLKVYKHTGTNRKQDGDSFANYDIILTTYGLIRNDLDLFCDFSFHYIILDESQAIKNPESKIFHALRELNCKHRLVLTGTPIENSLTDLWSQMTFINPGILGGLSFFRDQFQIPVEKEQNEEMKIRLKQIIEPFILRRTKNMVENELPELTEKVYYCEMLEDQKKLYEMKKAEVRNFIMDSMEKEGRDKSNFIILKGLMQLRLLANHQSLLNQESTVASGKFEEVIMNIENLLSENHKVLIFSQFVKHLQLFKDYFETQGWTYSWLTGNVTGKQREEAIKNFQTNPANNIFLISLKAGGVGINLTAADYVFILDPWWNPAVENQAVSRAHRIGQKKNVIAYKFITKDTIEEKILLLQARKTKLVEEFINSNNPLKNFTNQELQELLE